MRSPSRIFLVTLVAIALQGCAAMRAQHEEPPLRLTGVASWYGQEFAGRSTANGEIFDPKLMTAAHRTLPFGTVVEVRNPKTGESVRVRINDRGPFIRNRVIDLSWAAARKLSLVEAGVGTVELVVLGKGVPLAPEAPAETPALPRTTIASSSTPPPEPAVPPIEFPLPDTAAAPEEQARRSAAGEEFSIDVVEIQSGVEQKKRVADDGRTFEVSAIDSSPRVAATGEAPALPIAAHRRDTRYVLQVGAFVDRRNADDLERLVDGLGEPAFVDPTTELHRVRVGPFTTKDRAIDAQERLERSGVQSILLTVE